MKKLMLVLVVLMLSLSPLKSHADICNGSWHSFEAGREWIEVRQCPGYGGNIHYIEIRNPNSYTICYNIKAEKRGMEWNGYILYAGDKTHWSTPYSNESWSIGAKRKTGACN